MLETLAAAVGVAATFTLGAAAIARAGRHADRATVILSTLAIGLGMLALIAGLSRLDARGPSASRAEARPEYGMSWRRPAHVPVN